MSGDGNFKWWANTGQEPEHFQGPYETEEEAIAQMRSEDGIECGFTVVEADKAVLRFDCLPADWVIERFVEHNEEAWGEGESDISLTSTQDADLEKVLSDTLKDWFERNGVKPRSWSFGEMRNQQYFPPKPSSSAA